MYRSRLVYRKTESMCIHEGLNKNLSQRINTTRSDREYEICHTELNAMCNCHDSSGRLLPLRVWGQPAVAAGLRTSKQRRDEWEVGESMKINLNLYLFLTPSNLSHASDVQKDLAPFTMTPCTHYNSKKLKEEIWRALGNTGPVPMVFNDTQLHGVNKVSLQTSLRGQQLHVPCGSHQAQSVRPAASLPLPKSHAHFFWSQP